MPKLKSLIIGNSTELSFILPSLLKRSGFRVDMISGAPLLQKSKFISNLQIFNDSTSFLNAIKKVHPDNYDFIAISDDQTLGLILNSDIEIDKKLKLLPVVNKSDLLHLYSKINLSIALSQNKIRTPDFFIARNKSETIKSAKKLGYPIIIKIDSSGGGTGVFECQNDEEIESLSPKVFLKRVLVQKKIDGTEISISGFYQNGNLIHFDYSEIITSVSKFGPSSLRTYIQLGTLDSDLLSEMQNLGKALGLHGFANITAIGSKEDNRRYYIEADVRPNVWAEFAKFIGDDPAARIHSYFKHGITLDHLPFNNNYPAELITPYFLRLPMYKTLLNCHKVWKFLPYQEYKILFTLVTRRIGVATLKKILPARLYSALKKRFSLAPLDLENINVQVNF